MQAKKRKKITKLKENEILFNHLLAKQFFVFVCGEWIHWFGVSKQRLDYTWICSILYQIKERNQHFCRFELCNKQNERNFHPFVVVILSLCLSECIRVHARECKKFTDCQKHTWNQVSNAQFNISLEIIWRVKRKMNPCSFSLFMQNAQKLNERMPIVCLSDQCLLFWFAFQREKKFCFTPLMFFFPLKIK